MYILTCWWYITLWNLLRVTSLYRTQSKYPAKPWSIVETGTRNSLVAYLLLSITVSGNIEINIAFDSGCELENLASHKAETSTLCKILLAVCVSHSIRCIWHFLFFLTFPLGCALALAKGNLWLSSGPMVRHNCHGMTTSTHPLLVLQLFYRSKRNIFLSFKTFKGAVKQVRDVWKWSFHGNYVGP